MGVYIQLGRLIVKITGNIYLLLFFFFADLVFGYYVYESENVCAKILLCVLSTADSLSLRRKTNNSLTHNLDAVLGNN